ncbi:ClbS/DfsB family four-helix bundle protein [Pseudomonas syringae group genomosp. 3]|nr:ClbS/DfsB family four-helix bundle protein [Pseudomonas syringae group genomosp. 3]
MHDPVKSQKILTEQLLIEIYQMESGLTIIKSTNSLAHHSIDRIPSDVLDLFERCYDAIKLETSAKTGHLLKLLAAFFHVTGFQVTYFGLSKHSFKTAGKGFMRAVLDGAVSPMSRTTRMDYLRTFVKLMDRARDEVPLLPSFAVTDADSAEAHAAWETMKRNLDTKALRYWHGWEVQGRKGKVSYLPIPGIWRSYGEEFAELIYEKYRQNAAKQLAPSHADFNLFLEYLSQNSERWPVTTFQHPIEIKKLFLDFMGNNFIQAVENGTDIYVRTKSYSKFIFTIEQVFLESGVWARPFAGQLPRPITKSLPGSHTNLKKTKDGTVVKNKLITEIPLHITDSQAIDLLFRQIRADNNLVLDWARSRLAIVHMKNMECIALAEQGKIITGGNYNPKDIAEIGIENLCATYQHKGMKYLKSIKKEVFRKRPTSALLLRIGVPTVDTFFAFQMLLTHAHPCVTESFFTHFELYNKRGNLSGFLKTNSGYQLVGYKDRKGGALSEQKIDLTAEQADWVKLIISVTTPFRDELKAAGDDAWRYLFLHSGGRINTPSRAEAIKLNAKTIKFQQTMISEFMSVGNLTEDKAKQFIVRLSVTAFRASAGVEVYLNTHSVEEMARALGHSRYSSSLLSSYLPEAILAFFQTRWIRIFQRGIICRAMKDSPRLLEAARFIDMEELHEFLKNHALRDIPEHLQNPDYLKLPKPFLTTAKDSGNADRVIVSIDAGVLTALLSLKAAVAGAKPNASVCGQAIYWSNFSDAVVRDIEESFNSDLQDHLDVARQYANAAHMENLIYATAS